MPPPTPVEEHEAEHVEGFNEHVWYDVQAMGALAHGIQAKLEALKPSGADTFAANLDAFLAEIDGLDGQLAAIDQDHGGTAIFVTEPVPLYLTDAAGLDNVTPTPSRRPWRRGRMSRPRRSSKP